MKFLLLSLFLNPLISLAQDDSLYVEEIQYDIEDSLIVKETFQSTRIINGHSIETLRKGVLEFRVEHRFGDIGGIDGGIQTMFGFDNSSDIRIAFEYGLTDKLMVGLGRSKGTGEPYRSLIDGFAKYRVFNQVKRGFPFSMSVLGTTSFTYMKASSDLTQVSSFPKWEHRLAYSVQLNLAKKFGDKFSFAVMPTLVHRNFVAADDDNTIFSLGSGLRLALNSKMAILLEYYHCFTNDAIRKTNYNSLGVAFEWFTFGHNFTVNLTNSSGFGETQFITNTFDSWNKGQFRLGFCIGRKWEKE
ncbi:MAG: hypothetical protein KA521_07460 [Crocinitomicaceae bacterium]|nr:hypothetical protein [Crocinitomicaceae bacterium]